MNDFSSTESVKIEMYGVEWSVSVDTDERDETGEENGEQHLGIYLHANHKSESM